MRVIAAFPSLVWISKRTCVAIVLAWAVASVVFLANDAVLHDRSVVAQYFNDFARLLTGDLGRSLRDGSPVASDVVQRLPRSLELLGFAASLSALIGIPGGLLAAIGRHTALDRLAVVMSDIALGVPVFVVGMLLMLIIAQTSSLIMPAIAIAIGLTAFVFHVTRDAVLDVTQRSYVRTARANGLGSSRILLRHVLPNALLPLLTRFAQHLGTLIGSTLLVEYAFGYPGLASLLVESAKAHDYPVVQGVVLIASLFLVTSNLAADLLRAALDPRVRAA
jgi:ABC-type dipeptide/oligopeptide/nickel transport system permease component